jgi:hypothetical protein
LVGSVFTINYNMPIKIAMMRDDPG